MNIQTTKTGGIVKWGPDTWLEGMANVYGASIGNYANLLGNSGLSSSVAMDAFRHNGCFAPGVNPVSMTSTGALTSPGGVQSATAYGTDGYMITNAGKLWRVATGSNVLGETNGFPRTITGGAIPNNPSGGSDIILYQINGDPKIFYRYSKTASGIPKNDIGKFTPGDLGASITDFEDDFMSVSPSGAALLSGYNEGMIIGEDDMLYILNGNALHRFNGTTTGGTADKHNGSSYKL
jgi:hypothetical protein